MLLIPNKRRLRAKAAMVGSCLLFTHMAHAAAGGLHCSNRLQEIHDFIKDNATLSFVHDKLQAKYQLCLQEPTCAAKQEDICHWVDPVWEVMRRFDYKNVGFGEKTKRCELLSEISKIYEKEWNALSMVPSENNLLTNEQQEKYFTEVGDKQYFNLTTIRTNETWIETGPLAVKHYIITGNGLDGECGDVKLDYFIFASQSNKQAAAKLNQLIASVIPQEVLAVKKSILSPRLFMQKRMAAHDYTYYYAEEIDYVDDSVLSFTYNVYTYSGGAHGGTFVDQTVFNLKTDKKVKLEDIFAKTKLAELMQLARKRFMKQNEVDAEKGWDEQGYWFKKEEALKTEKEWLTDDGFYLPKNFKIDSKGITFIYQQYEVAPYVMGMPSFNLTWEELTPFLQPQGIGTHFLSNKLKA